MLNEKETRAIRKALRILESKRLETNHLTCSWLAKSEAELHLSTKECEVFTVFFLTSQYQIIGREDLFTGTINAAQVYVREVVKASLKNNAAAVVFAHNHPSGSLEPSDADRHITDRLKQALKLVDIQVLDHVIVANGDSYSFQENGIL